MSKCRFILIILSFAIQNAFAQQNNIWYFGKKAGLNFNSTANQPIPFPVLNSAMDADEGSASICDNNGNLLFYSNGLTVYNRNHQVMVNGDGLMANISTVQSCIIVPLPANENIFYIFTADALENSFNNGYRYSIVDMTQGNGDGAVTVKNNLLSASGTERMVAIRHADGVSVWLVTNDNNSNIFRSWLITCAGLQTTPVISTMGSVLDQHNLTNTGMLKASPDGKQICQTHFPFFDEIVKPPNFCQVFDFDNASGALSNVRTIGFPNSRYTTCEFSPDSKLLYVARSYDKAIDQLEITLPSLAAVLASRVTINTDDAQFFGIQAGPDQKIYLSQPPSWFLGAINKPNSKGAACDFQKEQVDVRTGSTYAGLPAFINDLSFSSNNSFSYAILDSCTGTVQFQGISAMPGILQWQWDFGDGTTSNIQNPVHTFDPADKAYVVKIEITSNLTCGTIRITKNILPKGIISTIDFDFFASCDSGYVRFTNKSPGLQNPGGQYTWDFGDGNISTIVNPLYTYDQSGSYPVKLKLITTNQCLDDSLTKMVTMPPLPLTISDHQTIFTGQRIQLFANAPGNNNYLWSPANGLNNPALARPFASPQQDITYKVKVTNGKGCSGEDSVHITIVDLDDIYVPSAFTPNNDGKNDQIKPFYGSKFALKEFSIFNRWGERVFTTRNQGEGWTGKINGLEQNPGVYIWILKYTNDTGKTLERKGSLVLIR
ncbi:MAG: gliding motility-associated C-terminal domain-containing protein [Chitinophagaceae bacterium]|nr:gliding motility-associated C-terminal domain-containing protein [Chitinophagaceae bacterium]